MWPWSGRIMPASLRVGERGPESPWTAGRETVANAMVGILVSYISLQLQQGMSGGVEEWQRQRYQASGVAEGVSESRSGWIRGTRDIGHARAS
jgi:hypothetical protein